MDLKREDLRIQREQCADEGFDLQPFEAEFKALDADGMENDPKFMKRALALLDATTRLKPRDGWAFEEPDALRAIRRARPDKTRLPRMRLTEEQLLDRIHGGWTGCGCGCLLGCPVEGKKRWQIEKYLKAQNRWPLARYFSQKADEALARECGIGGTRRVFEENISCMVEDDDMNYTTVGLAVVREYGGGFKPEDVGEFWLNNIPILHTCTAERVAYRNIVARIPEPDENGRFRGRFSSASFRNPYREWIGAQIRADFFGYCSPGDPEQAAGFAWRDACISHVKNGIYGEMWAAAMIAAAYVLDDVEEVIRAGLAQIPAKCRLARDIEEVLAWRREGRTYEQAVEAVHAKWDEKNPHHWCHTNSNAQIVALALLWGNSDYGKTICLSVMPGFDTDCNGATAGSVLGVMLGRRAIPAAWTACMQDRLETGVHGYHSVSIPEMAKNTLEIVRTLRN
jgi:hypothetical protein